MHPTLDLAHINELYACLTTILALAADIAIPAEDRSFRLAQYAAAATGAYCPEVAFDPVAGQLRALAARGMAVHSKWIQAVCAGLAATATLPSAPTPR